MPTAKAAVTKKIVSKKTQTPQKTVVHKPAQKKLVAAKVPVVKKTVAKKTLTPKPKKTVRLKQKPLIVADNARSFWVADGKILNSLLALQSALDEMEAAVYAHHVTKEKNDFAQWVSDVLCDKACASALTKAKTPTAARTVVVRHLKSYQL